MDFSLNEDQLMIRDAAREVLAAQSDSAAVRRAMESESGLDDALWHQLGVELGWCGIAISEAYGGLELGQRELVLLLEQLGEHLSCVPFFSSVVLAASALQHAAGQSVWETYLPRLASGELSATLAWAGLDSENGEITVTAYHERDGYRLDGHLDYVVDGASAELLLIPARLDNEPALFAVEISTAGVSPEALTTMDPTRGFASVTLSGASATYLGSGKSVEQGLVRTRDLARLALAAEQLGVAQRCLDLSVAYTGERVQFGRAIASFQAVKHRCAEMMVRIEAARSAVYGAAATVTADPSTLAIETAMAKSVADEAAFFCAQEAIQLHGGVGFTWEYDPHLYFKRVQANAHWLGSSEILLEELAVPLLGPA
ncbi:acyl-CoA dehydrogenase family protein [Halomonas sp. PR-M31]|uniref:acyl-CoA dehydrogenase family protein n=1 Tax=Halomonas sp. PR-M31 TaxID=1471202 RepID=UPI000651C29C|nr:acyl-CoA dehydrogenase family protein [Halomonas sp. PR-M31]